MTVTRQSEVITRPTNTRPSGLPEADLPVSGPDVERLIAQRIFFAAPFHRVPDDLYSRVEQGSATRDRHLLVVEPHSRVSTNTYFGRLPASYWQRWTTAAEVRLEVVLSGSGLLSIVASDRHGRPRVVAAIPVHDATERQVALTASINRFVDGGALWLEFTTQHGILTARPAHWSVSAPPRVRPTALIMCTFNRADDCLHTLEVLAGDEDALQMVDAVYVIDQGTETVDSRQGFQRIFNAFGARLHYRQQPNLGGSGGFTRGLYEVAEVQHADHANVLFMDDDILLEPDVVLRMTSFANRAVEPVIVGAQMLQLLHPNRLHVSAETARFTTVEPGLPVTGGLDRVDLTEKRQEVRVDADYNAWWCCLIPSEIVADAGYPLPFFFQWDDVEYGYRARARGHATVTLPGAGVWHADFDWKDEDEWPRYFTLRNALIIDALHGDFRPAASARAVRKWLLQCLVSMRYAQAATLIKAVEDFLRGPDVLHDGGVEALAAVRELRKGHLETQRHPASQVPSLRASARPLAPAGPTPSMEWAVLVKRLVWQLLRKPRGTVSVSARDAHWWHVSLFETVVVTDASQEAVRVRRLNQRQLIMIGRRAVRVLRRLRREGAKVQRQYRAAMPELTSRQNWQRLFERR